MSVIIESIHVPAKGRISNSLGLESIYVPVKGRIPNSFGLDSIYVPVKGRIPNSVAIVSVHIPIIVNTCIVTKDRAGTIVPNYDFQINGLTYTTDYEGKIYVYLPEESEVTITGDEGTYLPYSANVTRPLEIDQGYFEHVITLYPVQYYYGIAKRGFVKSSKSNIAKLTQS